VECSGSVARSAALSLSVAREDLRPVLGAAILLTLACNPQAKEGGAAKEPAVQATTETAAETAVPGLDDEGRKQPSYQQFAAWLEAFNASDRDRFERYLRENAPDRLARLDAELGFREMVGGFDLRKVEHVTATTLRGIVEERASDNMGRFELEVKPDAPHQIVKLDIRLIPRPEEFAIPRLTEAEVIAQLEALVDAKAKVGHFSGSVLLAKNADVLVSEARGHANREKELPNTLDTGFRIGSMNKMFTAVAVLQLVQVGKIEIDANVGKYLRDYPGKDIAKKVTIHHLLTHTGGTGDFFGPQFDAHRLELKTHADYMKSMGDRPLEFEPGSQWRYSNFGILILGRVIEVVSGQSYYDYVARHIYAPAGMTATGSEPEDVDVPHRSLGYMRPPGESDWKANTDTLPYRGTAAGGGYSTVRDLQRFARALLEHELLDAKHTELLLAGKVDTPMGQYAYGFIDARDESGIGWVGHGGGAPGMNGDLRIYPETGYVIAALTNIDPPAATRLTEWVDLRLPAG
jgi:CubicO group peptidase (beta-lactamase class C family)